jgi:hypothetical protein
MTGNWMEGRLIRQSRNNDIYPICTSVHRRSVPTKGELLLKKEVYTFCLPEYYTGNNL